jgi:hypothetical protein
MKIIKNPDSIQAMVAHAYNPSYSGGRGRLRFEASLGT